MNSMFLEIAPCLVPIVLVWIYKSNSERLKYAAPFFGDKKLAETIEDKIRVVLARQYLRQQAISFGLWIAAITIGLLLSSSLVFRLVFAPKLNLVDLGRGIVIAGDIFMGLYAYRSYQETSTRAEALIIGLRETGPEPLKRSKSAEQK